MPSMSFRFGLEIKPEPRGGIMLVFAVLCLLMFTPQSASAQSTWRPIRGGGGKSHTDIPKVDIPDMHRYPRMDNFNPSSKTGTKSAAPDTAFFNHLRRVRAFDDSTSIFHPGNTAGNDFMFGWLLRPVRTSLYSPAFDPSRPVPDYSDYVEEPQPEPDGSPNDLHYSKSFRISGYLTGSYSRLVELNSNFIDYELNEINYQNHEPMNKGSGWGLVVERYISNRWSWQVSFEMLDLESTDRQTWTNRDPDTGEITSVRDEQILQILTMAGAFDFKHLIPIENFLLSAGLGVEGRRIEMNVAYKFGEPTMYEYWTEPKIVPGLRAIVGLSTGLGPFLVLNIDGGYRLLSKAHPDIDGRPWYWQTPTGTTEASIDMSGFFWNAGVGVQF